jgi:ABC-2 type transport system ATP-binding protein
MDHHAPGSLVLECRGLTREFKRGPGERIKALDDVSLSIIQGAVTGLVGPDGAGKTTFIRLAGGLIHPDEGSIKVLGIDVTADPQAVQSRIGYMPQRFGLYEDLTVRENLDLYADLHGLGIPERTERYPRLMRMTGLGRFTDRLAGRLSGGMKQKLGLACTLVSTPDLLLLDEPTVGVDPLSRRELWEIVYHLVKEQGLTVILSTSYLDEAERCDMAVLLLQGRALAAGPPSEIVGMAHGRTFRIETPPSLKPRQLQARLTDARGIVDATLEGRRVRFITADDGSFDPSLVAALCASPVQPRFEDGFMILVRRTLGPTSLPSEDPFRNAGAPAFGTSATGPENGPRTDMSIAPLTSPTPPSLEDQAEVVVAVDDLVKQFGTFCAVSHVSFQVRRGEIFGLLGPNGAGKSTTFRMLCGLLPASRGTLRVAGMDLRTARASARRHIGYVAQKFSLYGQLTVMENLEFFADAYGLRKSRKAKRLQWAIEQFALREHIHLASGQLPGGYKQRLAMACALMHEPEILFLDEPTSGADPLARREFWRRISGLADAGVTIIVTTHFMEEAEYCDRMVIMVDGRILAAGTPADIRQSAKVPRDREPTIEDAFISIVEDHRPASEEKSA